MTRPLRIGLTGGIASGKSTVTQRFAELGVPVIDADVASRNVVAAGTPGLAQVVQRFGPPVLYAACRAKPPAPPTSILNNTPPRHTSHATLHPLVPPTP